MRLDTATELGNNTGERSEIKLPHQLYTTLILIRHNFDKIEKVYPDVILENSWENTKN